MHPLELCAAQSATQESTTRLKSNLRPWSPSAFGATLTSTSGFLFIAPDLFEVSVRPVAVDEIENHLQSQQIPLTLSRQSPNISSVIKERGCGYFHNDEMGTNKKTITWPFFFPICTYLTLLYTIEIYKYYKIFFFFFFLNDEQALACYLIPMRFLVIKSVCCRIKKVSASLCGCMCKNLNRKSDLGCLCCVSCWNSVLLKLAMWQRGENKNWWGWIWAWNCVTVISEAKWGQFGKGYFPFHNSLSCSQHTLWGQLVRGEDHPSWRVNHTAAGRLSDECVRGGRAAITMVGRSGSGIWMPCLSKGPDIDDSSSSPLEVQTWVGWDSTCDSLYHSRHRTEADRRSLRCRTCCSTCTLCTASGTSSQRPSLQEWTAGRTGGLSVHSRSRTPTLLTGQFCDWFWSLPGKSHSNY